MCLLRGTDWYLNIIQVERDLSRVNLHKYCEYLALYRRYVSVDIVQ